MKVIRALSALLLAGQLFWLAAPALCHMPAASACHEVGLPGGHSHRAPAAPLSPGCTMPALCGIPAPAVTHPVVALSFASPLQRVQPVEAHRLLPADPTAPLPPPPEA